MSTEGNGSLLALREKIDELRAKKTALDSEVKASEEVEAQEAAVNILVSQIKKLEEQIAALEVRLERMKKIGEENPGYRGSPAAKIQLPEGDWDDDVLTMLAFVLADGDWTNDMRQAYVTELAKLSKEHVRFVVQGSLALRSMMASKVVTTYVRSYLADLVEDIGRLPAPIREGYAMRTSHELTRALEQVEQEVLGVAPGPKGFRVYRSWLDVVSPRSAFKAKEPWLKIDDPYEGLGLFEETPEPVAEGSTEDPKSPDVLVEPPPKADDGGEDPPFEAPAPPS